MKGAGGLDLAAERGEFFLLRQRRDRNGNRHELFEAERFVATGSAGGRGADVGHAFVSQKPVAEKIRQRFLRFWDAGDEAMRAESSGVAGLSDGDCSFPRKDVAE